MKVFIAFVLAAFLVLFVVIGFISVSRKSSVPGPTQSQLLDKRYSFTTAKGDEYPLNISWEENYLLVSGVLQKQSLLTNKSLILKIPSLSNFDGVTITTSLADDLDLNNSYISVLKLQNGKFEAPQVWVAMKIIDLIKYLIPGHQVAVYVNVNQEMAQNIIANTASGSGVVAKPITHFIVGDFSK